MSNKSSIFANEMDTKSIYELGREYKSELLFLIILSACVALGHWLSQFIPVAFIENVLTPIQHSMNTAVCWVGAWLLFRHSDGLRIRRASAYALIFWGIADAGLLLQDYVFHLPVLRIGSNALNAYLLLVCNFLGWILLIYPTETLRPGWLNLKRALLQLGPLIALVGLDYLVPIDLRWLISLYPAMLFALVLTHLRAYRVWCEENYSSMEHIDVQWIVRYLFMLLVVGVSYLYVWLSDNPGRIVTQNFLLFFMFTYSIEQILFRHNPWENILVNGDETDEQTEQSAMSDERERLEQWMATEKPYLNPNLRLIDLQEVLPMNRSYLSQLIHREYNCSFYQFINQYRIKEAKRLMLEYPTMKIEEVATRSGFASRIVFSSVFTRQTGMSPREWSKNM